MSDGKQESRRKAKGISKAVPWVLAAAVLTTLPFIVTILNWLFTEVLDVSFRLAMTTSEFITYLGTIGAILWAMYQFRCEQAERDRRYEHEDYQKELSILRDVKKNVPHASLTFCSSTPKEIIPGEEEHTNCQIDPGMLVDPEKLK